MKYFPKEECNETCIYRDFCISGLKEYEELIIAAARDIADLTREVVGLRYLLKEDYPFLEKDMYKGLENRIDCTDLYLKITEKYGYDPLNNQRYRNDLYRLRTTGRSWKSRFPFSIKYR